MNDVIFISFCELNAEDNFANLLRHAPLAKRIHGISPMWKAFRHAADIAASELFYVIDGDNRIINPSCFDFAPQDSAARSIHIWRARNAVNDLEYGYGGVKLFSRAAATLIDGSTVDVIENCASQVCFLNEVASETVFNTSPVHAWRAGFRESAMLGRAKRFRFTDSEAQRRLKIWKTEGRNRPFGNWAIQGAIDGESFAIDCELHNSPLERINDYKWLTDKFIKDYGIEWVTN
jgi:hypothetical protein